MALSSDLINSVKARASVPNSQVTFQPVDFYRFADEEIRSKIVPLVLRTMEEYYVKDFDYSIQSNQAGYFIPSRAIASKLRDVQIAATSSQPVFCPLERLNPEQMTFSYSTNYYSAQKRGFFLEGNQVVLNPVPTSSQGVLRLKYYCRPGKIVDVTACAQVVAFDSTAMTITVASLPSTMGANIPVDFVKANPGFDCSAMDQTIVGVAGNVLTFGSALPSDLSIGDYVCLAGQSCVLQIPVELEALLFQYCVVRVLSAQGDQGSLNAALVELKKLEENAMMLLSPRVDGKPQRVVNSRNISRLV